MTRLVRSAARQHPRRSELPDGGGRIAAVQLPPPAERLPVSLARRIALAAQGLADERPVGTAGTRQLRSMVQRLAVVQIDSVNVLSRSHYLPAFSRFGGYPRELLDALHAAPARRVRVLGARGLLPAGRDAAVAPVADGCGRGRGLGLDDPGAGRSVRGMWPSSWSGCARPDRCGPVSWRSNGRGGPARCGTGTPARRRWSTCSSSGRSPPAGAPLGSSGSTT